LIDKVLGGTMKVVQEEENRKERRGEGQKRAETDKNLKLKGKWTFGNDDVQRRTRKKTRKKTEEKKEKEEST
jgi:hypothetical protein